MTTIRPHAVCPLHIHSRLDGPYALRQGTGTVLPTIRPLAVYSLHIPTSLHGKFLTHSRDRTRSASNTVTCLISIAHSLRMMNLTRLFRRQAIGRLFTLILQCPPRSTVWAPVRLNGLISFKPFLCRKLGHFRVSNIWQCSNSRTWPILLRDFEILSKSKEESPRNRSAPKKFEKDSQWQTSKKKYTTLQESFL